MFAEESRYSEATRQTTAVFVEKLERKGFPDYSGFHLDVWQLCM
jgi:hypothetical protein